MQTDCHRNAECENGPGFYRCACRSGYSGDGHNCTDIDECQMQTDCHRDAECENVPGSYNCACRSGYSGDGHNCTDIDECLKSGACHTAANCDNLPGDYNCTCQAGFSGDGENCTENQSGGNPLENVFPVISVAGAVAGVGLLAVGAVLVVIMIRRRRKGHGNSQTSADGAPPPDQTYVNVSMSRLRTDVDDNGTPGHSLAPDDSAHVYTDGDLDDLYSNNLVKERKYLDRKHKIRGSSSAQGLNYCDGSETVYSEPSEPTNGGSYDMLRIRPAPLAHSSVPAADSDVSDDVHISGKPDVTYDHLKHAQVETPMGRNPHKDVYGHLYGDQRSTPDNPDTTYSSAQDISSPV